MANSQGNGDGFNLNMKDSFNLLYLVAKGHAMCFLPFFRRNFGSEALGVPGLTAFSLMLVIGAFGRIAEMPGFIGLWLVVMLCQRASTMRAMSRGVIRHSRYEGDVDSKICHKRSTIKLVLEPLACVVMAVCLETAGLSHEFAVFIGTGAVSLWLVASIDRQLDKQRVQAMRDAAIEQQYLAARFHGDIDE